MADPTTERALRDGVSDDCAKVLLLLLETLDIQSEVLEAANSQHGQLGFFLPGTQTTADRIEVLRGKIVDLVQR